MGFETSIEWCAHTFNGVRGCSVKSEGCANCYAWMGSKRNQRLLGKWGPNGWRTVAAETYWKQPLDWNRKAEEAGERQRVFAYSYGDVFEEWDGPMTNVHGRVMRVDSEGELGLDGKRLATMDDVRQRLWWLIQLTPWLDWMLLTKRPEKARQWCIDHLEPPNLWLGVSAENQERADERIPILLDTPAAVRFVSAEPLLGPICFNENWLRWSNRLDLVILGGESGPKARPCNIDWIRKGVEQLAGTRTACFVKQLGAKPHDPKRAENIPGARKKWSLEELKTDSEQLDNAAALFERICSAMVMNLAHPKGGDPGEWPEELRVQQMPAGKVVMA